MKSRKFTYILIASVAAVWGIIFYKVILASDKGESDRQATGKMKLRLEPSADYKLQDTFSLSLNYRDPFSGLQIKKADLVIIASLPVQQKAIPAPKPLINRELVRYGGYIVNPGSKRTVSILTVEGKERMMSEGESANGLLLIKNHRDSVKITYRGMTYFVGKTN